MAVIEQTDRRSVGVTVEGVPIELIAAAPQAFGTALVRATGSPAYVAGLEPLPEDAAAEMDIFGRLRVPWCPPELREQPFRGEPPALVELAGIRGDLHCHTTRSDGTASVEEMARAAAARGYEYLAICDHTPAVGAVPGLKPDDVRRQADDIARVNELLAPFRVLRGIECDILPDGRLDLPDEVLAELDWVQASVHAGQRTPRRELTKRVEAALRNPHVRCLSHPTGRYINRRPENTLDLERVYEVALDEGVYLEVNGLPAPPRPQRRTRPRRTRRRRADRMLHRRALRPRPGQHAVRSRHRPPRVGDRRRRRQHTATGPRPRGVWVERLKLQRVANSIRTVRISGGRRSRGRSSACVAARSGGGRRADLCIPYLASGLRRFCSVTHAAGDRLAFGKKRDQEPSGASPAFAQRRCAAVL